MKDLLGFSQAWPLGKKVYTILRSVGSAEFCGNCHGTGHTEDNSICLKCQGVGAVNVAYLNGKEEILIVGPLFIIACYYEGGSFFYDLEGENAKCREIPQRDIYLLRDECLENIRMSSYNDLEGFS